MNCQGSNLRSQSISPKSESEISDHLLNKQYFPFINKYDIVESIVILKLKIEIIYGKLESSIVKLIFLIVLQKEFMY